MTRPRKPRADSSDARVAVFQRAAEGEIQPPAHVQLRDGDLPFWGAILRTRAREVWTDADLLHAANLTRCLADIERLGRELHAEGDVIRNDKGTQIANPKHILLETLSRRSIALTRMLQVAPRAAQNASRDAGIAKAVEEEADDALGAVQKNSFAHLIPSLHQ